VIDFVMGAAFWGLTICLVVWLGNRLADLMEWLTSGK
jgi:hypothetical protein